MQLKVRKSKDDVWCFVEEYSTYHYSCGGNVKLVVGIGSNGVIREPLIYRGEEFVPLSEASKEVKISRYIKAKKPFYCPIQDSFIVSMKVSLNYLTGEFIPDKSSYIVYSVSSKSDIGDREGTLHLSRILQVPEKVDSLVIGLMKRIAALKGSREEFFNMRIQDNKSE